MKIAKKAIFTLLALVMMIPSIVSAADGATENLKTLGEHTGFVTEGEGSNVAYLAGYVVNIFFGVLGIIFIVIMLIAGFNYMIAQGDEGKVKSSIATIRHAIIGLIILIGSYAIYIFVWSKLTS